MKFETSKKRLSTSILISMTDVVFLLILFLLISSSFISQHGIPIKLPSSSNTAQQNPKTIAVTLTANDQIFVEDQPVSWEDLPNVMNQKRSVDTDQVIYLRADEVSALKQVVRLMDIIRNSGFERIYIATKPLQETRQ